MKQQHRASVLSAAGQLHIEKRQTPTPQGGEALLAVEFSGVCGTDIALFSGHYPVPLPLVLGHEIVGRVVEVGSETDQVWVGRRVVTEINNTCRGRCLETLCVACDRGLENHCFNRTVLGIINADGGYAEYVRVPVHNLHTLPAQISSEQGVFVEPLAAAIRTFDVTPIQATTRVVVLGAGRLGLLICGVAARLKAQVCVVSRSRQKLQRAQAWGAAMTVSAAEPEWTSAVRAWTDGLGADLVVEATGVSDGLQLAAQLVRPRGVLSIKTTCGIPANGLDITKLVVDEIQIHTSRCGPFPKAIRMLTDNPLPVASLISEVHPLEDAARAITHAETATKILIRPE